MPIRINREAVAGIVQSLAQRREEATYQGPRSISDGDVQVTLPLDAKVFSKDDIVTGDSSGTFNDGTDVDSLSLDLPDGIIPLDKFGRLVGFTYGLKVTSGDASSEARCAVRFTIAIARPQEGFTTLQTFYADTLEMNVVNVAFPYGQKLASFNRPVLFAPGTQLRFNAYAGPTEQGAVTGSFQTSLTYAIALSDIPIAPPI